MICNSYDIECPYALSENAPVPCVGSFAQCNKVRKGEKDMGTFDKEKDRTCPGCNVPLAYDEVGPNELCDKCDKEVNSEPVQTMGRCIACGRDIYLIADSMPNGMCRKCDPEVQRDLARIEYEGKGHIYYIQFHNRHKMVLRHKDLLSEASLDKCFTKACKFNPDDPEAYMISAFGFTAVNPTAVLRVGAG